jgi:hypothetical protein
VFSIKRNLVFMNNLYRKVAAASVGIALGFTLGANKEAKAATFTLTDPEIFFLAGYASSWKTNSVLGSRTDISGPNSFSVQKLYPGYERRAFYEFDIGNLPFAPNTVIRRAILKTPLRNVSPNNSGSLFLRLFGYVGNGKVDLSDFEAGVSIGGEQVMDANSYPRIPRDSIDFDVTSFVNERVNSRDDFAGFGFRVGDFRVIWSSATLRDDYNAPPSLIIETADATVPEPTTIFGSAIGLCLGGWLKRKKSNQQKKTIPQH